MVQARVERPVLKETSVWWNAVIEGFAIAPSVDAYALQASGERHVKCKMR